MSSPWSWSVREVLRKMGTLCPALAWPGQFKLDLQPPRAGLGLAPLRSPGGWSSGGGQDCASGQVCTVRLYQGRGWGAIIATKLYILVMWLLYSKYILCLLFASSPTLSRRVYVWSGLTSVLYFVLTSHISHLSTVNVSWTIASVTMSDRQTDTATEDSNQRDQEEGRGPSSNILNSCGRSQVALALQHCSSKYSPASSLGLLGL